MPRKQKHDSAVECPVEATLDLMGGKWKGVILFRLIEGTKRFGELQRLLCKISQRTLTNQLRQLEADGLINRKVYAVVPPKVEYSLTERGRSLSGIMQSLYAWCHFSQITSVICHKLFRMSSMGLSAPRFEVLSLHFRQHPHMHI